ANIERDHGSTPCASTPVGRQFIDRSTEIGDKRYFGVKAGNSCAKGDNGIARIHRSNSCRMEEARWSAPCSSASTRALSSACNSTGKGLRYRVPCAIEPSTRSDGVVV